MPEPDLDRWAREVEEQSKGSVGAGLGLTLVLHFIVQGCTIPLLLSGAIGDEWLLLAFGPWIWIGLSQLVYMVPAILIFRRRGDTDTVKGLVLGASFTMLINSACAGFFFMKS